VDFVVQDEGFVDGVGFVEHSELVEGGIRHIKSPRKSIISGSKISPSLALGKWGVGGLWPWGWVSDGLVFLRTGLVFVVK